jgi:hypothetical protein
MMAVGTLGSLANGATIPLMILVFTSIIDSFSSFGRETLCSANSSNSSNSSSYNTDSLMDKMKSQAIYLVRNILWLFYLIENSPNPLIA